MSFFVGSLSVLLEHGYSIGSSLLQKCHELFNSAIYSAGQKGNGKCVRANLVSGLCGVRFYCQVCCHS